MPPSSGQKQLNTVHALTSYFCTFHLNIKFPSKPKSLCTFSERTLNSFGKSSWGPNRHTKLYSTTASSGKAVGEEDHYFFTVRK